MAVWLTLLAAQLIVATPDPVTQGLRPPLVTAVAQGWEDGFQAPVCRGLQRAPLEFSLQRQFTACAGFTGCLIATAKRLPASKIIVGSVQPLRGGRAARFTITLVDVATREAEVVASADGTGALAVKRAIRRGIARACEELRPELEPPPPPVVAAQDLPLDLTPSEVPVAPSPAPAAPPAFLDQPSSNAAPLAASESEAFPTAALSPPPAAPSAPIRIWPRSPTAQRWTIACLAVAGGATIAGGALGGSVLSATAGRDNATTTTQFYAAQSNAQRLGVGANVAFGVGALAAVAAIVFWAKGDAIFGVPSGAGGGF